MVELEMLQFPFTLSEYLKEFLNKKANGQAVQEIQRN